MFDDIFKSSSSASGDASFDFADILSKFTSSKNASNSSENKYYDDDNEDSYDWKKAYLTLKDDFDSYRKRTENARKAEKRNLIKDIVNGFLDVVEYTLFTYKAKKANDTFTKEDEMILNKLSGFLKAYDVHPMKDPVGTKFDHTLHEAIITDTSGMFESGTVTMVISHGYMIGDDVLRYAKVSVAE